MTGVDSSSTRVLSFLMTDVEGSTKLWEEAPADMARALERHDAIVVESVAAHGGILVKHRGEGDSAFAVFDEPAAALACALLLQRTLQEQAWPASAPLRVRVALHRGEAQVRAGDYFGQAVNRCARVRAIGHGGQTLVTPEAADRLPDDAELRDLGSHRLKDLSRPQTVLMLCHPALAAEFPPLLSLDLRKHNLPIQLTTFVGRERELAEVRTLLREQRLVSLTGAGGCGKTRLALQSAAEVAIDLADGVWLADLAPLTDPDLVAERVAIALGEQPRPGAGSVVDYLAQRLADRELLIVLDNCEHVIGAAAALANALLRSCARVHILATSREVLGVPGEAVYRVPSLERPDPSHVGELADLLRIESVNLFCDRAESAGTPALLTLDTAPAVARICHTLEGIPLAIELAAARTAVLSPAQIADRLDDRFALLTRGNRTALPRHQTLRALVDWSHDLLDAAERTLLRRLSVFLGGFRLEGAESVCEPVAGGVMDVLARLVDKSLVTMGDEGRYGMLETIRQYAIERLVEADEETGVRERHIRWCLEASIAPRTDMLTAGHVEAVAWFEAEHDNIRAALHWGVDAGNEDALRLCAQVYTYWQSRGHLNEGRYWLREAADRASGELRAELLHAGGRLAVLQGDLASGEEQLSAARELAEAGGSEALIANIRNGLGVVAMARGDFDEAERILSGTLEVHRRVGAVTWVASTLNALAVISTARGRFEIAEAHYAEGLAVARETGNVEAVRGLLMNSGNLAAERGDDDAARRRFEECLAIAPETSAKQWTAMAKHNLATLHRRAGDLPTAQRLFEESLAIKRELGDVGGIALSQGGLADLLNVLGRPREAARLLRETVVTFSSMGAKGPLVMILQTMAVSCEAYGDPELAARLLGASAGICAAIGSTVKPRDKEELDEVSARLRTTLGDTRFDSLVGEGTAFSLDEVTAVATAVDA